MIMFNILPLAFNNLVIQWGSCRPGWFYYPLALSNKVYNIQLSVDITGGTHSEGWYYHVYANSDLTKVSIGNADNSTTNVFIIGY